MEPPKNPVLTYTLLDPCAGTGEAIFRLQDLWKHPESRFAQHRVVACELEAGRAGTLQDACSHYDQAFHGDAFRLHADSGTADVLFLNPPYDTDKDFGRLELRFLDRFTQFLSPGGALLALIPHTALAACTEYLAHHYLGVQAWRLPDEDFERFGQIFVVGTRAKSRLVHSESSQRLETWSRSADSLPVLPPRCLQPRRIETSGHYLEMTLGDTDLQAAFDVFRPFDDPATGFQLPAEELFGRQFTTAMPPKPVHIAMALSTGMFNGHPLIPGDEKHPVILLKGVFERIHVPVRERTNEDGDVTAVIEEERPRLITHILRLDTGRFHQLEAGVEPTGSDDPNTWNLADVIELYERSLVHLLRQQFPPLYDPHHFADRFPLPRLPRKPYPPQAHAVRAILRLLAEGLNPILDAEVGTGKTTMSLTVSKLLSPEYRSDLVRLCPFADRLPVVERTLVVCPPHLLDTWEEEAAAVSPDWPVRIVREASDLETQARVYVLSRETAKLGPRVKGVSGTCPACGAPVAHSAASNARNRRRCEATHYVPANQPARLARHLARVLMPADPGSDLVAKLAAAPALARHYGRPKTDGSTSKTVSEVTLGAFLDEVICTLERAFGDPVDLELSNRILQIVPHLAPDPRRATQLLRLMDDVERRYPKDVRSLLYWKSTYEALVEMSRQASSHKAEPIKALKALNRHAEWTEWKCHELLYGLGNTPRRYPLSKLITRRYPDRFDLVILDEAHEFNHADSAQARAAHRLVALPGVPTLAMTGTLMNGYASSLFANLHALVEGFREEFRHDEQTRFVRRFGFLRTERNVQGDQAQVVHGTTSDRKVRRRKISEAPGVMPGLIFRHLLPTAVVVHKEEVAEFLPPKLELPAPLVLAEGGEDASTDTADPQDDLAQALITEYQRLQTRLLRQIKADRRESGLSGKLFGALGTLPSYLDRATDDLPPFEIRYPESVGGQLIARAEPFPADWRTPKEVWLLERLEHYLDRDENVVVFLSNTGTEHLPYRLLRLIREVTPDAEWLDVTQVPTQKRNQWIKDHRDLRVLLVNPEAVKTGLNSLTRYSVALWHQLAPALTYRQANGRLHRLGQTKPVTIKVPYYRDTAQEIRFHLLAETVSTSKQVDALDLVAALKAAGASPEETTEATAALSLGQAIYQALGSA